MKTKPKGAGWPGSPPLSSAGSSGSKPFAHSKAKAKSFSTTNKKIGSKVGEGYCVDTAPYDHEGQCPRICSLVERGGDGEGEGVSSEELDPLQQELEHILLHNMETQRGIAEQLGILTDGEHPSASALSLEQENGKSRRANTPIVKRCQSPVASGSKMKFKIPKLNPSSTRSPKSQTFGGDLPGAVVGFTPVPQVDSMGRRRMYFWPQNHMPDKFWQFVSEYCEVVNEDDMKILKELLRDNSDDRNGKYYRMPGLGKHYSLRWKEEEIEKDTNKQKESGKKVLKRKLSSPDIQEGSSDSDRKSTNQRPPERKSKRLSSSADTNNQSGQNSYANGHTNDQYCLGPLTERLVQALVEENSEFSLDGDGIFGELGDLKTIPEMNGASPNKALVKSLNLGNMAALEKRIKRELEEQGLLDGDDDEEDDEAGTSAGKAAMEDEVTIELRQRQEELKEVTEANRVRLNKLITLAKESQEKSDVEGQLEETNHELVGLYRRFYNLVPKRKPSNKKEKDLLSRVLKEREKLICQLDIL